MLKYLRAILGSYKIVDRRRLLNDFASRVWPIGPEEAINYAAPVVYGGPKPPRMLEFVKPISLEAPFVCEVPNVELVGDTALPVLKDNILFYEALSCGDEKELLWVSMRLKRKTKVDVEYDTAFCLIKPHSRGYFHWWGK